MYQSGDIIDQYRLSERLGAGSYGTVWAAENIVSKQKIALKVIPLCGRAGARELRALRQYHDIEHPNLLKIHHSGVDGDYLYYTMDFANGKLADQNLSPSQLRVSAMKIADALAVLHEHGLLHRDLKPDNLFWLNGEPLIGDIGLVTADCGASLTGTPGFLSPAVQKSGAALSERSDLYALAKSFYCLLSGNPPGEYPKYSGPVDPDAAILMQGILNVCDDTGKIANAAVFRDYLRTAKFRKKHFLAWIACLGFAVLISAALTATGIIRKPYFMQTRSEQMISAIQKAEDLSAAEKACIDRQNAVYEKLKTEANNQAETQYPRDGETTSFTIEVRRYSYYSEQLEKAVQNQTEKDPEFRCFYVLWKEAVRAEPNLTRLTEHPEQADEMEKDFQLWQEKYKEYCKLRDTLL